MKLIKQLKPEEPASPATVKALNDTLKKLEVKGGEVKEISRGQVWQFEDAYRYLDQCAWHCLGVSACKYRGMSARAWVVDGKLNFEYLGCGKFFAMQKCLRWAMRKENKKTLEELKKMFGKEPYELSLDEWKGIMGNRFWNVVNKLDDE